MSQKIVIPKGTIDSAHTTIIEIPNYLHETSTVVVTTPKTTDSSTEQSWEVDEYQGDPEQNESDWEQGYDAQETNEDAEYPEQQEQYEGYKYDTINDEEDSGNEVQQPSDQGPPYTDYVEEVPAEPMRRTKVDTYSEQMRQRMLDKKREILKMRAERQRMMEGETAIYEAVPDTENIVNATLNMAEVPANMRGRSMARDYYEKDKKRRLQEFERRQLHTPQMRPRYEAGYHQRDRSASKYLPARQNVQYAGQQWNPEIQGMQGYNNGQYVPQGQFREVPVYPQRRQVGGQANFVREEFRQPQKARRKPVFSLPRN